MISKFQMSRTISALLSVTLVHHVRLESTILPFFDKMLHLNVQLLSKNAVAFLFNIPLTPPSPNVTLLVPQEQMPLLRLPKSYNYTFLLILPLPNLAPLSEVDSCFFLRGLPSPPSDSKSLLASSKKAFLEIFACVKTSDASSRTSGGSRFDIFVNLSEPPPRFFANNALPLVPARSKIKIFYIGTYIKGK
jgi:hypothetical protein